MAHISSAMPLKIRPAYDRSKIRERNLEEHHRAQRYIKYCYKNFAYPSFSVERQVIRFIRVSLLRRGCDALDAEARLV